MIASSVSVDVSGFKFVIQENKKRDVTLRAARAGAKVLQRAAKAEVPRRTGTTRKAQGVIAKKGRHGETTSFAVQGVRKRYEATVTPPGRKKPQRVVPAFIDHLIQGGTRPHSVSKGQRLGRTQKTNKKGQLYGKAVAQTDQTGRLHPGSRANPYRKRAWNAVSGEAGQAALAAMADGERKLIEKVARDTRVKMARMGV